MEAFFLRIIYAHGVGFTNDDTSFKFKLLK